MNFTPDFVIRILPSEVVWVTEGALSMCGLIINFLIFLILQRFKTRFNTNNFWLLAKHLCAPNLIFLILILFYVVPCTIADDYLFGDELDQILANVFAVTYYVNLMFMFCMSLERFVKVVLQKHWAAAMNSYKTLRIMVGYCWSTAICIVLILNLIRCRREYNIQLSRFPDFCPHKAISNFMLCFNYFFAGLIVAMYATILVYIRIKMCEVRNM